MKIDRDKIVFIILSLIIAISLWRYAKIEKMSECQVDQNSHEDCLEMIKRLD